MGAATLHCAGQGGLLPTFWHCPAILDYQTRGPRCRSSSASGTATGRSARCCALLCCGRSCCVEQPADPLGRFCCTGVGCWSTHTCPVCTRHRHIAWRHNRTTDLASVNSPFQTAVLARCRAAMPHADMRAGTVDRAWQQGTCCHAHFVVGRRHHWRAFRLRMPINGSHPEKETCYVPTDAAGLRTCGTKARQSRGCHEHGRPQV